MGTDKHLKLRAAPSTSLGQVISYIQNQPVNNQELSSSTLQGRFLPFTMDKNEPHFRSVAIRCATECEAWARAIREYAGLETPLAVSDIPLNRVAPSHNGIGNQDYENDGDEIESSEIDLELEERKKQRREGDFGF